MDQPAAPRVTAMPSATDVPVRRPEAITGPVGYGPLPCQHLRSPAAPTYLRLRSNGATLTLPSLSITDGSLTLDTAAPLALTSLTGIGGMVAGTAGITVVSGVARRLRASSSPGLTMWRCRRGRR